MGNVVDAQNNWPCQNVNINPQTVTVTMPGDQGLNAVCTGQARNGQVQFQGNGYNVRLPGSFQAGSRIVTFRR
jgi:hypothetical protein